MSFEHFFPVWDQLNMTQKNRILDSLIERQIKKGTMIHNGSMDCTGLLLVKHGQLRAYTPALSLFFLRRKTRLFHLLKS